MNDTKRIARWADQLRDMSANGLKYAENVYDKDRYRALQTIAMEMFSCSTGQSLDELEPLRESVLAQPTPMSVADAAIIEKGQILLIRRSDNRKWAMPGGFLEVGESAASGAVREALEETGRHCRPVKLVGIYDSDIHGSLTPHQMYIITVLCVLEDKAEETPTHSHETLDMGWFSENELPGDFSLGHEKRIRDSFSLWKGEGEAFLDL